MTAQLVLAEVLPAEFVPYAERGLADPIHGPWPKRPDPEELLLPPAQLDAARDLGAKYRRHAPAKGRQLGRRRLMAELLDLGDAYRPYASSRASRCDHFTTGNGVTVQQNLGALPHYGGLQRCGLVWECPCCGARIKSRRAAEVTRAVDWHVRRYGAQGASMATFTIGHGRRDDLAAVRRGIAKAWQLMARGKSWIDWKRRVGFVGSIRALEVTHGFSNGWHPHLHVVLLTRSDLDDRERAWLFARWSSCVRRALGPDHAPLEFDPRTGQPLGVDLRRCHKADYLAKLGLELSSPNTKRARGEHRTPLEILADFGDAGTMGDLELYREFVKAMKGARQLTWSKGLKAIAEIEDLSDEQLVEGDEGGEKIGVISRGEWRVIRRIPKAKAGLLEMAHDHGARGMYALIDAIMGRPPAPDLHHRILEAPQMLIAVQYAKNRAMVA